MMLPVSHRQQLSGNKNVVFIDIRVCQKVKALSSERLGVFCSERWVLIIG